MSSYHMAPYTWENGGSKSPSKSKVNLSGQQIPFQELSTEPNPTETVYKRTGELNPFNINILERVFMNILFRRILAFHMQLEQVIRISRRAISDLWPQLLIYEVSMSAFLSDDKDWCPCLAASHLAGQPAIPYCLRHLVKSQKLPAAPTSLAGLPLVRSEDKSQVWSLKWKITPHLKSPKKFCFSTCQMAGFCTHTPLMADMSSFSHIEATISAKHNLLSVTNIQ